MKNPFHNLLRASAGYGGPGLRSRFSPMRKASRRRGALPGPTSLGLGPTKEVMK